MRIGILTSTDTRHRYFVNALRRSLNVVAVGYQDTGYVPSRAATADGVDPATAAIVTHHFAERSRQETLFFGHDAAMLPDAPGVRVRRLDKASLNSNDTVAFLQSQRVDAVAIYGTSMIKPPLWDAFANRMINMHLGLSPYYRGTATNFYPLVNEEPQYVGATIHMIDAGIDSGPILHHARPDITADDMPHTVGCKAILAGIETVIRSFRELAANRLTPVCQWTPAIARLYLRKDYQPAHVVKLYRLIEDGLFPAYAARKNDVAPRVRLVP